MKTAMALALLAVLACAGCTDARADDAPPTAILAVSPEARITRQPAAGGPISQPLAPSDLVLPTKVLPSATATSTTQATPASTATATTAAATSTPTATATSTARPSSTPAPTATAVHSATPRPSATPVATNTSPTQTATARPNTAALIIDHSSVALFGRIPDRYINQASQLRMLAIDRSVGSNINDGLTCLGYPSAAAAPAHCRRPDADTAGLAADPKYNRSRWDYQFWEDRCDYWYNKPGCFVEHVAPLIAQYDVFSPQLSYLDVASGSTIMQPGAGFFDNTGGPSVRDFESWESSHPDKVLVYATTNLARTIGTVESQQFNQRIREYVRTNGKVLLDIADIESHAPDGQPCYDSRDGVQYCTGSNCENFPNDGIDIPAICPAYTSETEGGHLGSMSTGKIRLAQAYWVLMARLAGWDGVSQ